MQPSTSMELGLRSRHLVLLRELSATLPPHTPALATPCQPLVDSYFDGFEPHERLGQARHLLFSTIATPSRQRHLLHTIASAAQRVGTQQSEHFQRLFEASSATSLAPAEDAERGKRLAQTGESVCTQLVMRLSGLSPEEMSLPDSLRDCVSNLFTYVQRQAHFDSVWRQGLLYRSLTMAQGADEGCHDSDRLRAWADREVEAAWSERVTAIAVRWLTDEDRETARSTSRDRARIHIAQGPSFVP